MHDDGMYWCTNGCAIFDMCAHRIQCHFPVCQDRAVAVQPSSPLRQVIALSLSARRFWLTTRCSVVYVLCVCAAAANASDDVCISLVLWFGGAIR